jgi:diacylglycerol kinase (ATP)
VSRCFISLNPRAGRGRAQQRAVEAARLLRSRGREVIVTTAQRSSAVGESKPGDTLIACGGDGTVHAALQQCIDRSLTLGVLPAGNGNDIARSFGIARWSTEQLVDRWLEQPTRIDVGQVSHPEVWFLGVLATGFDSRVNARANTMRGRTRYVRALAAELPRFGPLTYRTTIDGQSRGHQALMVCIGNGAYYGAGMAVCPNADVTDGELDVTIVSNLPRLRFLALFPSVYRGTHAGRPEVLTTRARQVTINAPGQAAFADGEFIGPLPVTVTVHPAVLSAYPAWS